MRINPSVVLGLFGAVSFSLGVGYLLGNSQAPWISELAAAQMLASDKDVRLIGFVCGDHNATVVAQHEDEFPEPGCVEIRKLSDDVGLEPPPSRPIR